MRKEKMSLKDLGVEDDLAVESSQSVDVKSDDVVEPSVSEESEVDNGGIQGSVEDGLLAEDDEVVVKSPGKSLVKRVALASLLAVIVVGGGYATYQGVKPMIESFTSSGEPVVVFDAQGSIQALTIDVNSLRSDMNALNASERLVELEAASARLKQLELLFGNTVAQLQGVSSGLQEYRDANDKAIAELTEQLASGTKKHEALERRVTNMNRTLSSLEERLFAELEKQLSDVSHSIAPPAQKNKTGTSGATTASSESAEVSVASSVPEVTRLGPLFLKQVVDIGGRNIAIITDGLSGSIQLVSGNSFGHWYVSEVNKEHLVARHKLDGRMVNLVVSE
ncbi:hypothetical protein AB6E89_01405 [Vibrio breoganii]